MSVLPSSLATPRLELRSWVPDDVDLLDAAIEQSLDHLRPWMPWVAYEPMGRRARLDLIEQWQSDRLAGRDAVFGVFRAESVVGGCGLHRRAGPNVLEIGYWTHADHLRRGYATELSTALTTAAFEFPEIDVVEIHHDRANTASAGVPRKLGFQLVSEAPDEIAAPGEIGIDCCWRMARNDWPGSIQEDGDARNTR